MNFVNINQIKEASILEPYKNSGEPFEVYPSHGWQLVLTMEYCNDGYHHKITIDLKTEEDCHRTASRLGLSNI